jgi:choline dehydrogenase-like flavoprotein
MMVSAGDKSLLEKTFGFNEEFFNNIGKPADYGVFAQGSLVIPTLLHAKAVGDVRLKDKNPLTKPLIQYEAFAHEDDLNRIVSMIRILQELLKEPGLEALKPTLLEHKTLAREFGFDSDKYWREYVKRFSGLLYHPSGTCKMGLKSDAMAVVDSELQVFDVEGLRIADTSIMPDIVSGSTNAPAAVIALKLVDVLKKKYDLQI